MTDQIVETRYFTSYSGVALPLKLVGEITTDDMENRNTFFEATYDTQGKLLVCRKLVYGEVDMEHRYQYNSDGVLHLADISNDGDDFQTIHFDAQGQRLD